ncbi:MAG: hypothetical protein MK081_04425 [Flavobacteriales bacterium]|nr:hypothetical protein [Flavobacteriales bacterium]
MAYGLSMTEENNKKGIIAWIKRIGIWAFLFFLLKGIGWLLLIYFGIDLFGCN